MPKIHLQSIDETKAVCYWPWNDESANFQIIEKWEMCLWLTTDLNEVTCSKCKNHFKKTNSLEPIENEGRGHGWIIKATKTIPDIKGFNTHYIISMKKDGNMMTGSTARMGKVYKSEKTALKIADEISKNGMFKTELIKV